MKIKLTTFLLLFAIIIFSCNRDEESNSTSVVGKWTLVSFAVSNFEGTGNTIDDSANDSPRPTFEFMDNGVFVWKKGATVYKGMSYKVQDNKIIFSNSLAYGNTPIFSYSISNNTMILTSSDKKGSYTETTKITLTK